MKNNLKDRVANDFELNADGVWIAKNAPKFGYSDGVESERYLRRVFTQARDLSSTSHELERWIKDWPSEYHLSRKRTQLLRGLEYRRDARVLEVGCGCGAITRFLGETFDDVLAIEGSEARAGIARLRTRGLDGVTIVSAPYQDVQFQGTFDVIFCIGVLEYAGMFVPGDDPYAKILQHFSELLAPDGQLVLAIENQFGLKYFSSSQEDHTNRMFEGIEGYPLFGTKVRTFGYGELKKRLLASFSHAEFHFPYPDYKIPDCVISEHMMEQVRTGELVGQFRSRDYSSERGAYFDEARVLVELDRNAQLPFFSNSFLAVASKSSTHAVTADALGVLFSTGRSPAYCTVTRFTQDEDGLVWADKRLGQNAETPPPDAPLKFVPSRQPWRSGLSLQRMLVNRTADRSATLEQVMAPCAAWWRAVKDLAAGDTGGVPGRHLDAIWRNAFFEGDEIRFIDQEWEWREMLPVNLIFIRAACCFLADLPSSAQSHPALTAGSTQALVARMGKVFGVSLAPQDFARFVAVESAINSTVRGLTQAQAERGVRLFLWNRKIFSALKRVSSWGAVVRHQAGRGQRFGVRLLQRLGALR